MLLDTGGRHPGLPPQCRKPMTSSVSAELDLCNYIGVIVTNVYYRSGIMISYIVASIGFEPGTNPPAWEADNCYGAC